MRALTVVAAVIFDEDQILACRRAPGKAAAGKWEFPGGKVESDESPAQALVREIREELGAPIRVLTLLRTDTTRVAERDIELMCFRAELVGPRPTQSTDHDLLAWVRGDQLGALDWAAPDLPMVQELIRIRPAP